MAFDIRSVFGNVCEMDIGLDGREQIEYLTVEALHPDPNNFYELSGLEELAANIELLGLQQPIRVRKAEDGYVIVSGHRRTAAIRRLVEEGQEEFRQVPCIVEAAASSPELQELRLIFANSDTRTMTSAELSRQAERVEELLYKLKEQGMEFPGRMRDHVAAACKMSKSKLARLKVIRDNLQGECLRQAWEDGRLNESCAYEIARRPKEAQDMAAEVLNHVLRLGAEEIADLMDSLERQAEALQREVKSVVLPVTSRTESYEEYAARIRKEDAAFFSVLEVFAEDLLPVVPKMGTSRRDNIAAVKNSLRGNAARKEDAVYSGSGNVLAVCKGDQSVDWLRRNWTEAYDMLAAIAINRLRQQKDYPSVGCADSSPDKGSHEENGVPVPVWQEGLPKKWGRYVARFDLGDGKTFDELVEFDAWERSFFFPATGDPIEYPCIGWWPVPDDEVDDDAEA